MPADIYQAYREDYQGIIAKFLDHLDSTPSDLPETSLGMYISVNCCDDKVDAQTALDIERYAAQYPALRSLALTEFHLGAHITQDRRSLGRASSRSVESQPVVSDIPTLILAGQFDQNTPSYWGRLAGETLSNSHYVEFPGMGHGVIRQGECAAKLISEFYVDPDNPPDESCVKEIEGAKFTLPS